FVAGGGLAGVGCALGQGVVEGGRDGLVRQRAVAAFVVVDLGEAIQQRLQVGQRGGLVGLGAQPSFEGLLEAFDLALGLRVAAAAVDLGDVPVSRVRLCGRARCLRA